MTNNEKEHQHCLVCGSSNPNSFGLKFYPLPDGRVTATFQATDLHQGYDGILHGGVVASILDAAMTHCLFEQDIQALTAELEIRYHHPISCTEKVDVRAELVKEHPPLYHLKAEIVLNGKIMANAHAKFIKKTLSKEPLDKENEQHNATTACLNKCAENKLSAKMEREVFLPTQFGSFKLRLYRSNLDNKEHLALIYGSPESGITPLVRIHSECLTGDVFGSMRCDCGEQMQRSMEMIQKYGYGVIVYLRQEGRGIGLGKKIHAYELQEQGMDTVEANIHLGFAADLRDYRLGAYILQDLNMPKIKLLTNNPAKIEGLDEVGITIEERIPLILPTTEFNETYLATKRDKMRHMI